MFIDSHAHLYLEQFKEDIHAVLDRAKESDISHIFLPNIDRSTIDALHELEKQYPILCSAMMGLHPCSVTANYEEELAIVKKHLDQRDYAAVGEIGIDLYWDKSFVEQQKEAFRVQSKWANDRELPIVIHSRESIDLLLEILETIALPGLRGVFHCFSGTLKQAQRIIDLGFLMGIGGVITFKNSGLDQIIKDIDLKNLVLETDAPYLTPHPYRGQRNESSYVRLVAQKLGQIYEVSEDHIGLQTSANAMELFRSFKKLP